jgi:hypothetical protein
MVGGSSRSTASGSFYYPYERQRIIVYDMLQGHRRVCPTSYYHSLYRKGIKKLDYIPGVSNELLRCLTAIGQVSSISKINKILVRQLSQHSFYNGEPAYTGIQHSYGLFILQANTSLDGIGSLFYPSPTYIN